LKAIENKIIHLEEVSQKSGDSVVLCHGHFNIIHPGHIRYLDYAHKQGSKLVVSLQGDRALLEERKHHFNEEERALGVASLEAVDQVVLLGNATLRDVIHVLNPSILVLGKEFENELQSDVSQAVELLQKQGGMVLYHAGEAHYASSELLQESQLDLNEERLRKFQQSCKKQNLTLQSLLRTLEQFDEASLLVIGDTIVDQYVACDAMGMSAEAPVIVVRELESREYVGGAAIVSAHVQALGAKCHYLSVVGEDANASLVGSELQRLGVKCCLIKDHSRPTSYKIRYLVDKQKIFRVSRLKEHGLNQLVEEKLIHEIKKLAPQVRGILVNDFVYGVVTPHVLETVAEVANQHQLMVFGDLQCSSQIGDVSKFKNFHLLCPTEREARIALGTHDEGVEWVANTLMERTCTHNLIMKLGLEGFIAYENDANSFVNSQHFPALTVNPVDVAGAGDSLLAVLAVGMCSGASLMQSAALGACMASLAVQTVGNIPISRQSLQNHLQNMLLDK